ncbi:MAG: hypothetical protein JSV33_16090 [bacterium]|nr:MAG: hypothetical protein JSV33_16090 [bacterium]
MKRSNGHALPGPPWVLPLASLVIISILLSFAVYKLSGGREVADDAKRLIGFARHPFILWGDYRAEGLSDAWGSFPPLLPLLFGILITPWLAVFPDFWGFRIGVLSWSVVAFFIIHLIAGRLLRLPPDRQRNTLLIFAFLPSVLGAIAFIPQEEIYVSLFAIILYIAARNERWNLVLPLLALTLLAGKYFLLVLAVPLAFTTKRPLRSLCLWGGVSAALLAAYIGYHKILFDLSPVIGHVIDPGSSLSIWALLWNLGFQPNPQTVKLASLLLVIAAVFIFSRRASQRGLPLPFTMSGTLYITLLCLSITFPAYVLWTVPLTVICTALMERGRGRAWSIVLLFLWGFGEWGANFLRGVHLALRTERAAGKTALANAAERFLGDGFPYQALHVACIAVVIACGIGLICLLWTGGLRYASRRQPALEG